MNATPNTHKTVISPNFLGHLLLIMFGLGVFVALQYHYWYGEFGHHEVVKLKKEVATQQRINTEQARSNAVLMADIADLKSGLGAVEEHARLNLGFIKKGETFVQLSTATTAYSTHQSTIGTDSTPATEPVDVFSMP